VGRRLVDFSASGLFVMAVAASCAVGADIPGRVDPIDAHNRHQLHAETDFAARVVSTAEDLRAIAIDQAVRAGRRLAAWYRRTPPADRVTWGGMAACAGLGLIVLLERLVRLRKGKIIPAAFTARFLDRLHEGKVDCGHALDHCERNPSPAARVALAAVRRWDRPAADQERAVALAHRVETERLRRNVGTLRRIAVLTPLLGLLGTLFALGRALEAAPAIPPLEVRLAPPAGPAGSSTPWGTLLAATLTPLSAGIIIATLALVAYDGLLTRIEKLAGALDRLGAETIDAIALTAPISSPTITLAPGTVSVRTPHQSPIRRDDLNDSTARMGRRETGKLGPRP
jgi:biopolymer transport protein ExbB